MIGGQWLCGDATQAIKKPSPVGENEKTHTCRGRRPQRPKKNTTKSARDTHDTPCMVGVGAHDDPRKHKKTNRRKRENKTKKQKIFQIKSFWERVFGEDFFQKVLSPFYLSYLHPLPDLLLSHNASAVAKKNE